MFAQIDFSRESNHEYYTRIKFYDPSYCKLGASLRAVSLTELYESLQCELEDLVIESFIKEEDVGTIMSAFEDILRIAGVGFYIDLHIDECTVAGSDFLERLSLRELDEDDRKDIPLAGTSLRKLVVDVQI